MRLPAKQFTKMLSSITDAQSPLRHLTLTLFTWRLWEFSDSDVDKWALVDVALVELCQAIKKRSEVDLVVQVIAKVLEYGPHDIRDILPRLGGEGLVRLVREGDSTSELS